MSLFNKFLASIGVGSAVVDTLIQDQTFEPGGQVKGVIQIRGGNIAQNIDDIYLRLYTYIVVEKDDKKVKETVELASFQVAESFEIKPNEEREIPFGFFLPPHTPVTLRTSDIWIRTGLDIKNALDPRDTDYIRIRPNTITEAVLSVFDELGFRCSETKNIRAPHSIRAYAPIVQEFEYVPTSGSFRGVLDEVELIFIPEGENRVLVLMEIDRKAKGLSGLFSEMLDSDETHLRLHVESSDLPILKEKITTLLSRYSR